MPACGIFSKLKIINFVIHSSGGINKFLSDQLGLSTHEY